MLTALWVHWPCRSLQFDANCGPDGQCRPPVHYFPIVSATRAASVLLKATLQETDLDSRRWARTTPRIAYFALANGTYFLSFLLLYDFFIYFALLFPFWFPSLLTFQPSQLANRQKRLKNVKRKEKNFGAGTKHDYHRRQTFSQCRTRVWDTTRFTL